MTGPKQRPLGESPEDAAPAAAGPDGSLDWRGSLDDVERALLAQLYFAGGSWQEGLELSTRRSGSESEALRLIEARARFGLGDAAGALALIEQHRSTRPEDRLAQYYAAQFLARAGRADEARSVLAALVERTPDFPGALQLLAPLVFPGPSYRALLERLHAVLRPRVYLEIGVEHGTTLALAVHSERALGIDPGPPPPARVMPAGARMFQMTSDAFFDAHRRADVLGGGVVDLAFIDGKHWFDYALRDFCNVESWCGPASTIVLHDCLPVARAAADRQRRTRFWTGDTWKALECLLEHRKDLHISIVPCQPSGLVVIQGVDPDARGWRAGLDRLIHEYMPLEYPYEGGRLPPHYPVVPNTEPALSELLSRLSRRSAEHG